MDVNQEGSNLQIMQQHAMKALKHADSMTHERVNLLASDLFDLKKSCCLNCTESTIAYPIISESDDQILIKLFFKEKVSVENVKFTFLVPDMSEMVPTEMRFYGGKDGLDFTDVEDATPGLVWVQKSPKHEANLVIQLGGSKFSKITSLQIFIVKSAGGQQSTIESMEINGFPVTSYHVEYKK
jgi:PITH domain